MALFRTANVSLAGLLTVLALGGCGGSSSLSPTGIQTSSVAGSYSSAEATAGPPPAVPPPAIRTRPSWSSVAVWPRRAPIIEPVGLKVPAFGSYSSADARVLGPTPRPPAMRTRPSDSSVAVGLSRATIIEPVGLKVPLDGLYNSADEKGTSSTAHPPAMRTRPSDSSVAVWSDRATLIHPAGGGESLGAGEGSGVSS